MTSTAKKNHKVLGLTDTPVGQFWLVIDDGIVVASGFGEYKMSDDTKKDLGHKYVLAVQRYFGGDMNALDGIKHQQKTTPFYTKVYKHMSGIKPGKTESYKDLAAKSGSPRAVRAVGSACKRNALPLIVPCHRVLKSDGSMGQYLFGVKVKQWLLAHEKANSK